MSNEALKNYMFLGLPKSGKTTCFCAMADNLQDVANKSNGKLNLRVMSDTAQKYIEKAMDKLHHQQWPDKTQDKLSDDLDLSLTYSGVKKDYVWNFGFHDYPGEAFSEAFIANSEENFVAEATDLKKRLTSAKGVFLLLSAESLFNDDNHYNRSNVIGGMLRFIIENNDKAKIAILFNKVELFHKYSHNKMVELFSKQYKIADGLIKSLENRCEFFSVMPVGNKCEISEEGYYVAPQILEPEGLLDPITWMIGLRFDSLNDCVESALTDTTDTDIDDGKNDDKKIDDSKIDNEKHKSSSGCGIIAIILIVFLYNILSDPKPQKCLKHDLTCDYCGTMNGKMVCPKCKGNYKNFEKGIFFDADCYKCDELIEQYLGEQGTNKCPYHETKEICPNCGTHDGIISR